MAFSDWINFQAAPMSAIERAEEVDSEARNGLARMTQAKLRARIDPGVRLQDAMKAQAIRVMSEGDRLVIDEEDQGAILEASAAQVDDDRGDGEVDSIGKLFEMSSGVPQVINGKLAYRMISMRTLFGEQEQDDQDKIVEGLVGETIRDNLVETYDRATADVERKYPSK